MYRRHQEPLRDVTHLSGVANCSSPVTLTYVLRYLLEVLVVHLSDSSVVPRMVCSSSDGVIVFIALHARVRNELI